MNLVEWLTGATELIITLIPIELLTIAPDVLPTRNFASLKSPTCAENSLSMRTLLCFKSQWTIETWHWWWRYSNAVPTSRAMLILWIKFNAVLFSIPHISDGAGCSHFLKLPLGMKSSTKALTSYSCPWKSMAEQEVMVFTRFQRWIFLRASHSAMKLFLAPGTTSLSTLMATTCSLPGKIPL